MRFRHRVDARTPEIVFVVRNRTEDRLKKRCFRIDTKRAGLFDRWSSAETLLRDPAILRGLAADVLECWNDGGVGLTYSVQITCDRSVGWASTMPSDDIDFYDLECFELGRGCALRVKLDRQHLRAPRTDDVTIVYELKEEYGHPTAVVHSIYPGPDIGPLEGNITEREGVVFFDWDHPGQ